MMGANEQTIYGWLTEKARNRETDYYSYVAPMVGLHHRNRAFYVILDNISRRKFEYGRPLLTAVVVCRDNARPTEISGNGFFALAEELGLFQGESRTAFWRTEIDRVYRYWENGP